MNSDLYTGDLDARVARDRGNAVITVGGALTRRNAPCARRLLTSEIAATDPGGRLVVDLGAVRVLDAAGIAAVTAPAMAGLRGGHDVVVLSPAGGDARRLADRVGVLPIGRR